MAEFHLTWPDHETTLPTPEEVLRTLHDLDGRFAAERRSVLVGIDALGGSLDVGLGVLHAAVMITTPEEPGYVSQGESASEEEVLLEFDGEPTPFPASALLPRADLFAAVEEFLETEARPTRLAWREF